MSISIGGISTANVSDLFVRDQLTAQLNSAQTNMYELETEISTGHQFQSPSQDPEAAVQVMGLESILERYSQVQTNISTNQTYLSQTDSTLTSVSNLLTSIQSTALSAVGSTASSSQRQAAVEQINAAIQSLVSLGNTEIDGRQLFGGTDTNTAPFSMNGAGDVIYSGNNNSVQSYDGLNQLFDTSVTGAQAFGALSQPVEGATLTPSLSADTPLADLNSGQGVTAGSIEISDGHSTSIVNLSSAKTLGDVATLIEENPPAGRTVEANVTATGLTISLQPDAAYSSDNLSVQEVDGGSTASDLGILNATGAGAGPLVGQNLDAAVTPTTSLDDLFGSKAAAYIHTGEPDSDIILQADTNGATTSSGSALNSVTVQFVDNAPAAGQEWADYTPGTPASGSNPATAGTLTVHISTSATSASTANQIIAAINNVSGLPFTASLDQADQDGGGQPPLTTLPATTTTAGGSGTSFDTSGLQIVSQGQTYTADLSGDQTVQDLLNSINNSGAGMVAQINSTQTGINVQSSVSGSSFSIGENGGSTAAQLGIRTFTAATSLSQLNYGQGVGVNTDTTGGTDFTISQTTSGATPSTVQVAVSIAGDSTVGDVLQSINDAAETAGANFRAQLATTGNGIELIDTNAADGPIVVTADSDSTAAVDLGLVSTGQTTAQSQTTGTDQTLVGSDTNPQQTDGIFTALINLSTALQNNDSAGEQRAMSLLTSTMQNLSNTRAELGVNEQSLTDLTTQVNTEQLNLQSAMSNSYDTDMASAASQFTAAQIAYQATLQITASLLQLSILNYIPV